MVATRASFRFAPGEQCPVGDGEAGRAAAEREGGQVEGAADLLAAAVDHPAAAHQAAVPGDRGETDQAGDLAPVELAELRQLGQQGGEQDRPGAGRAREQGGFACSSGSPAMVPCSGRSSSALSWRSRCSAARARSIRLGCAAGPAAACAR